MSQPQPQQNPSGPSSQNQTQEQENQRPRPKKFSEETILRFASKHPLQRLPSPSRGLSFVLHLSGLFMFIQGFVWLLENPNPINQAYGWHFQYLTIIGLFLATITFLTGFLADIQDSSILFTTKNVLSICSTPLEVLISFLYWSLKIIDPTLVTPPEFVLPMSTDLNFHLVPSVFLLIDLLFFSPPWTITVVPALGLSTAIALVYWFWLELCFSKNGFYPYPLMGLMDTTSRMLLFGGSGMVMAASTVLLKNLYGRVNGFGDGKIETGRGDRPEDIKKQKEI